MSKPGPRRELQPTEVWVLGEVQAYWGPQNTPKDVFLTDGGDAVLFVVAPDGSNPIMVNLTTLGAWYHDKTLSLDQLREQIKGPAAALRRMVTMMMPLRDEGVDVWRPVQGEAYPSGWYRVISKSDGPDEELWAFEHGQLVVCEERAFGDRNWLVPVRVVHLT